ncbi:Chitin synthase export chaperone [Erysiphe neolycopersici]|uniref:Chitin synthase export chaperone n=1 Tax=Erysiphe neolycopersici TaxID=212602 RepID=A0A420HQD7_9PEZI|nr:Chitin synthase export chaperone [Erysiphe neolycopersici]
MGFSDFESICYRSMLPLCPVVGPTSAIEGKIGIEASCYARNIELANTIIFQGAASFMHIAALLMTVIMIIHIRSKFTAVGRKEITSFFYIYMLLSFISLILDSGVVPLGNSFYPYFVAAQAGLTSALCMCLLINGFVGFQIYEDGTALSVWLLRTLTLAMFSITFLVALATFKSWAGLSPTKTIGLFIVLYILSGIELLIYVISQVLLVTNTLQDRWPLGDIAFGVFFLILGQIILYFGSNTICNAFQHYLDGLFFATTCNLLAVMMVYKYWDSITREDLEFSVGIKQNNWEVKDFFYDDDPRNTAYQDTDFPNIQYNFPQRPRSSFIGSAA